MSGFIGLNAEDRQLPDEVNGYRPSGAYIKNSSFKDTWNVDNAKSLPNTSIGFTTSQRLTLLKVLNTITKREMTILLTPMVFTKINFTKKNTITIYNLLLYLV